MKEYFCLRNWGPIGGQPRAQIKSFKNLSFWCLDNFLLRNWGPVLWSHAKGDSTRRVVQAFSASLIMLLAKGAGKHFPFELRDFCNVTHTQQK